MSFSSKESAEVGFTRYHDICKVVCERAEAQRYLGYEKHDALNSPWLKRATLNARLLRLIVTQAVMRCPVNLRAILGVKRHINPKGMALWAHAYLALSTISERELQRAKAYACLDWLLANPSVGNYSGLAWGYPYDWQDVGFYAPSGMPNCVVSCFAARALVRGYELSKDLKYLNAARSTCDFVLSDLCRIYDSPTMLCVSYAPVEMDWIVMDTSALAGVLLAEVAQHTEEQELQREARRLINFVVDKQTNYGAWFYSHPPQRSHIKHDNYHTGFIVDALADYQKASADDDFAPAYDKGLRFYAAKLFLDDGAPKWMSDQIFPLDIHGSAQGIISLVKAARLSPKYLEQACQVADWAIDNLYDPNKGHFYSQRSQFIVKRFSLMRWCNAWMARALGELASVLKSVSP